MQIISYLDTNMSSSALKKKVSLDFLLENQNFSRAKVRSVKMHTQTAAVGFVSEIYETLSGITSFVRTWKNVFLGCAALISFLLIVPFVVSSVPQIIKPVPLTTLPDVELQLLNTAMANFVFSETPDAFDENGNIGEEKVSSLSYVSSPVEYTSYSVKAGENITSISKKFGLSNISTLIAVNDISNVRLLRAGQKILIPSIDGMIHSVKKGESLASIGNQYNVAVEVLLDVNDLSSSVLQISEKIFIPGARLDSDALKQALGELFMTPLSSSWRLSSPYGYRNDPFTGVRSFHTGIDMVAPQGTAILSSMAGKVAAASYNQVYGNYVIVSHSKGYQTLYAHLQTITVKDGQTVNQGTKLGLLGNTGYSTGAHLHFSVYKNGKLVNPLTLLK